MTRKIKDKVFIKLGTQQLFFSHSEFYQMLKIAMNSVLWTKDFNVHLQKGEAIRQIGQCLDCHYCFIFVRVLILLLIRVATEHFSPKIKHRIPCGFLPLNTDKQRSNCLWEPDMKYFIHFFFFLAVLK